MKRRRISYSVEEMAWLQANRAMIISDYHRAFVAAFGRADVAAGHLHALRKRLGWKVGRQPGRFAGRHTRFSPAEIAWLRENRTLPIADYHRAFMAAFSRADVTAENLHGLRKRQGWKTGRTGRFEKGRTSENKGKRCALGTGGLHPNAVRTQFRKGASPQNYRGPGHEYVDSQSGYVVLIVDQTNPWSGAATRPVLKHRHLWEQAHGPIPDDMCLKCLDGDKANSDPSNWELVPRAILPRLNGRFGLGYDAAPAELKPTIMAVAKLKHQIHRRKSKQVLA